MGIWVTLLRFYGGSCAAYYISIIVLNLTTYWAKAGSDYYWMVFRVMGTGRYWLCVLLTTIIALFPSFTYVAFTTLRRNAKIAEQQHSAMSFSVAPQSRKNDNNNNEQKE
eukprot:TRINITY_DN2406_c0_g1_i1.p1 TRINITY_DN2406_c0_g1~~TRINITY_DN2406_c0_g1_i1.p1  ORF type:complete len:110 (+),score=26.69 TRINITY_DN2406_c0_g1_i1:132-461(+)